MLLWILDWLSASFPQLADALAGAAWSSLPVRAALSALAAFALALRIGPRLIGWLGTRFREPNVSDSPYLRELHRSKQGTPTMGGLLILLSLAAAVLLFADLENASWPVIALAAAGLAVLGAIDDLAKLRSGKRGLSARTKLCGQTAIAAIAALLVYRLHSIAGLEPGLAGSATPLLLGWWFVPWAVLVIVGCSNAVNLTDGLDGLAGGCLLSTIAALGTAAYIAGRAGLAADWQIEHVAGAGELTVLATAMLGATLGFLWFNCQPAQVFMGDTGSLPIGGLLGLMAVLTRQELLLLVVGGVFVVEAASVILQVGCFKLTRRRILLCAPLHHHFQFKGWPESKIVVRFWIVSGLCAALGLASLKLRALETYAGEGIRAPALVERTDPLSSSSHD